MHLQLTSPIVGGVLALVYLATLHLAYTMWKWGKVLQKENDRMGNLLREIWDLQADAEEQHRQRSAQAAEANNERLYAKALEEKEEGYHHSMMVDHTTFLLIMLAINNGANNSEAINAALQACSRLHRLTDPNKRLGVGS